MVPDISANFPTKKLVKARMELGSIMRIIGLDEWNSMEHVPRRQQLILKLTRGIVCSLLSSLMRRPNFGSSYSKWRGNGCWQWWKLKTRAAKEDAIAVQMLGEAHHEIRESAAISPQR